MVKQGLHRKYHELFGNKSPEEILKFLEEYFWAGNKTFVENYVVERDIFHMLDCMRSEIPQRELTANDFVKEVM